MTAADGYRQMGNVIEKLGAFILYGGTFRLRQYERLCIDAWLTALPEKARAIGMAQRARLDRFKRSRDGSLLRLFPTGWPSGVPLPDELRFPLREDESRVANVSFSPIAQPRKLFQAIIVLQNGQLTSLEFSCPMQTNGSTQYSVTGVTLLRDVCSRAATDTKAIEAFALPEGLAWLHRRYPAGVALKPRSENEIRRFVSSFKHVLPTEFVDTLHFTNGVKAGPVTTYGIGSVWTMPRPDGPFVIVASVDGVGQLAVKQRGDAEELYALDEEGDAVEKLSGGFNDSLEALSNRAPKD